MAGAPQRIVIMDDSEETLETAVAFLEQAGYQVAAVSTLDALVAAVEIPVDLVLMDVDMPDAEGDQLALALRQIRRLEAPILLYSALDERELQARALAAEVEGYLRKNADPEAILERVRDVLAARP
ncbi:MAG TPA: response regulator [Kofleriaceae bacterium]|jgi:two-component system response regulator MprA